MYHQRLFGYTNTYKRMSRTIEFALLLISFYTFTAPLVQGHCMRAVTTNGVRVHCINPEGIPSGLPNVTTHLILSCNEDKISNNALIRDVPRESFVLTPLLRSFETVNCPIQRIERGAFQNLTNFQSLHIENAQIEHLEGGLFANCCTLESLSLTNCPQLTSLAPDLLQGQKTLSSIKLVNTSVPMEQIVQILESVGDCLRELKISKHNMTIGDASVSVQQWNTGSGPKVKLERIDLSENTIENLLDFHGVQTNELILSDSQFKEPLDLVSIPTLSNNLAKLNLSRTGLKHLRFSANALSGAGFPKMPRLTNLLLQGNFIEMLPNEYLFRLYEWTPSLTELDLRDNQITTLPKQLASNAEALSRLSQLNLRLQGNPIHCNCELTWLKRYNARMQPVDKEMRLTRILPCFTVARMTSENGYTQVTSSRTFAQLVTEMGDNEFACMSPTRPRIVLLNSSRLNRTDIFNETVHDMSTGRRKRWVLECDSSGDPPPRITWRDKLTKRLIGRNLESDRRGPTAESSPARLSVDEKLVRRLKQSRLQLYCEAENSVGRSASQIFVNLQGPLAQAAADETNLPTATSGGPLFPSKAELRSTEKYSKDGQFTLSAVTSLALNTVINIPVYSLLMVFVRFQ